MRHLFVVALVLAVSPAVAQEKEKLSATDLSVRTALTFKAADAAVQKLLPAGFELNSPTAGPNKGSNFGLTLIDFLLVQDPEGKPLPTRTTFAMNMPAKKTATGEAVGVVFNGLIDEAAVPGPYGVFGAAKLTVERASHTDADGKTIIDETWQAKADDGSMLEVQLQFARGVPARSKVEAKLHSAGNRNSIVSTSSSRPPTWRAALQPGSIGSISSQSRRRVRALRRYSTGQSSSSASPRCPVIRARFIFR